VRNKIKHRQKVQGLPGNSETVLASVDLLPSQARAHSNALKKTVDRFES
jgi:hypothetical protein